ncbi:MAG: metal ABC transporter substrate-binding protein [Sulfurimonas sp.]|uniref:metal ABC transporter substrate-binding protein n=1 Tax=Sulfurimonas sp. TaxID=2022749 RepID=UPI0026070A64|nr:metal ABC transporter substrate-binding protein [Sulfurimonas sp.]MCW8896243.1 metal ABC transporter substrate-binding protein [Sulfurimonas sp.]MCW8953423.1 metal ABC transporter substrate-binding protein [Sulfurimonas sp.]MCW9068470.1 metal ABC transporter substrate-binding protein [Sulfurimonas sp.]
MKKIFFISIIALFILFLTTIKQNEQVDSTTSKQAVALSTFSLYEIARHVADGTVETFMILPLGVDAHNYEPTPKQVAKLYKSDLVIYNGAGLEPWIDGFEFQNRAINMSQHVDLKKLSDDGHTCGDDHHHHHDEAAANIDPHYWLDIQNMIKATQIISQELIALLPQHKELYEKNRDSYIDMLKKLDNEYKDTLSACKQDTIVVNHNAFSYLSSRYGFKVEALSGLSPEAEPSAKNMAKLIEHVKEHKLKTIFFESFVNDKAIKSIADEAKVGVDVLQPLGNITADEAAQKLSYEDIMRSNLSKISKALECR